VTFKTKSGFLGQAIQEIAGNDLWISRIQKADERACPWTGVRRVEAAAKQMVNPHAATTSGDVR
jgi:hypothetical protein